MAQNDFSPTLSEKSDFLSVKDAANYLGVSIYTIYKLVKEKAFPARAICIRKNARPLIRIPKTEFYEWARKDNSCTN